MINNDTIPFRIQQHNVMHHKLILQIKLKISKTGLLPNLQRLQHHRQDHLVKPKSINLYSLNTLHDQLLETKKKYI